MRQQSKLCVKANQTAHFFFDLAVLSLQLTNSSLQLFYSRLSMRIIYSFTYIAASSVACQEYEKYKALISEQLHS